MLCLRRHPGHDEAVPVGRHFLAGPIIFVILFGEYHGTSDDGIEILLIP